MSKQKEQDYQQNYSLDCGKTDFWPVQRSACKVPMADFSEEPRYPGQQSDLTGEPIQTSRKVRCGVQSHRGMAESQLNGQASPASAKMLKCSEG